MIDELDVGSVLDQQLDHLATLVLKESRLASQLHRTREVLVTGTSSSLWSPEMQLRHIDLLIKITRLELGCFVKRFPNLITLQIHSHVNPYFLII